MYKYKYRANLRRFDGGILSIAAWCGQTRKHIFSNWQYDYERDRLKLYRLLHYKKVHQPEHFRYWQKSYQHDFGIAEPDLHKLTIDDFWDCFTDLPF